MTDLRGYWPWFVPVRLLCHASAAILLFLSFGVSDGQIGENLQEDPWAVDASSAKGRGFVPAVCGRLSYFSGSPLPFDFGHDLFEMPQTSFTYDTSQTLIATVQGHRIFQVVQQVYPKATTAPPWWGSSLDMKRILVERNPNRFCMIFQNQGPVGPTGTLFRIEPAKLVTIDGERVLITRDPVTGNGGSYVDGAWTFDDEVPISLFNQANDEIERALKTVVPPGCAINRGDPLDLVNLAFKSELWKPGDSMAQPTCGSIVLGLGIQNHRIVVVSQQYTP